MTTTTDEVRRAVKEARQAIDAGETARGLELLRVVAHGPQSMDSNMRYWECVGALNRAGVSNREIFEAVK